MQTERRADDSVAAKKSRRINWMLVVLSLCLGSVLVTLSVVTWDINTRANERAQERAQGIAENQLLLCMIVAAHDIKEIGDYKYCEKFDWWIKHQTNARETAPERNQILLCYMLRMIKAPHPICSELDAKARKAKSEKGKK